MLLNPTCRTNARTKRSNPMPPLHKQLQDLLSPDEYNSIIKPLREERRGDRLVLYAPNRYVCGQVRQRCQPHIDAWLAKNKANGDGLKSVEVKVGEPAAQPHHKGPKRSDGASGEPWPQSKLNPDFTFDSFVSGSCNRVALGAALRVAEKPGGSNGLLVLHGSPGLGKTHLMHAVGHCIHGREDSRLRVVSRRTQQFKVDVVEALKQRGGAVEQLLRRYQSADVLLFDDIQFIRRAPRVQEEFLKIFNTLCDNNRQIVLTSDHHPNQIPDLGSGLKSRLAGGLSVAIKPPDRKTCITILERGTEREHMGLAPGVAEHLAEKANSSVRELNSALHCVIQMAQFMGAQTVTMQLVMDALHEFFGPRNLHVSLEGILCAVLKYYKVKRSDILSKRRHQHLVRPRQMAMHLAREHTNHSYSDIGQFFGERHHTTVKSASKTVAERRGANPEVEAEYRSLVRDIKG